MNILDKFTSIDDLLVTLLERIGGVTEEDTHFFSYPNDGTRATIAAGTTKLDFMAGTVMTPAGLVSNLGNSLRARGREYCRSLSLQADRDIIIQIGTKSKIPVFAGTWFKVAHLRFTDVKIVAAEDTRVFVIACTNPDSIEMAGETYLKDPVDAWGKLSTIGNAELAARNFSPPMVYDRRGDVLRWEDFESATPRLTLSGSGYSTHRSTAYAANGDFSMHVELDAYGSCTMESVTNDFHVGRVGLQFSLSTDVTTSTTIACDMEYADGSDRWWGTLFLYIGTSAIKISTPGTDPIIGSFGLTKDLCNFSTVKLVIDLENKKYVRCNVFGTEYDLTAYDLTFLGGGSGAKSLDYGMYITSLAAVGTYYVDNMILTENEPI